MHLAGDGTAASADAGWRGAEGRIFEYFRDRARALVRLL